MILPKCDEQQINEIADFLLTTDQILQMEENELLFYDEGNGMSSLKIKNNNFLSSRGMLTI